MRLCVGPFSLVGLIRKVLSTEYPLVLLGIWVLVHRPTSQLGFPFDSGIGISPLNLGHIQLILNRDLTVKYPFLPFTVIVEQSTALDLNPLDP